MITFSCEACGERIVVSEEYAGKKGRCGTCGGVNVVPDVSEEPTGAEDGSPLRRPRPTSRAQTAEEDNQAYKLAAKSNECPHCRGEVPRTAKKCPHCGVVLAGVAAHAPAVAAEVSGYGGYEAAPAYEFYYAGFWRRFAAAFVDSLILVIGGFMVGIVFGFMLGFILGAMGKDLGTIQSVCRLAGNILGWILNWLYFALFECSAKQATLGKMALGIVVTDMDGKRISFGRASGRFWGKIISALTFGIGFIMAGFTARKQALHDIMASCLVVKG
ncbi:MAG: RDD family protein [Planctomycetota bacterium]|jgi:uncharacterized RDD family membrane protein YckC